MMDNIEKIINPLFWICLIAYFILKRKKIYLRYKKEDKYYLYITIVSFFYIIAYFYLGIYFGFAKSPYNHKLSSILNNIFIEIMPIMAIELIRTFYIIRYKNNKKIIYITTILLILFEINYKKIIDIFMDKRELFEYSCQEIVPIFINGILYTYLTLKTLYFSSLIFRVNIKLVTLLMPILPDIDWFVTSSFNILSAIIIYLIYKYIFLKQRENLCKLKQDNFYKWSYIISILLSLLLICFMVGIFRYEPITILSIKN